MIDRRRIGDLPRADFEYVPGWHVELPADLVRLHKAIPWERPTTRMYGRDLAIPRQTYWMGDPGVTYMYSGIRRVASEWVPLVDDMRHNLIREVGIRFNSCLANYYADGTQSVAWHSDDEPELGERPTIASVSIGEARAFKIRRRWDRERGGPWSVDLGRGDLLVMRGESQSDYEHAIPKTTRAVGPRINLTFRVIR